MDNSQKRRAENEVVFKQRNIAVKEMAKAVFNSARSQMEVKFTCECSNEDCREKIEMTIEEFEAVKTDSRDFIVVPGHEQADIERVKKRGAYNVVEKYDVPPATDGKLNKT